MEIKFLSQALKDRDYWKRTNNVKVMRRITLLLNDILKHPFTGLGKPEPLKGNLQGKWSRRITAEHRLIYQVSGDSVYVYVLAMRFHYQ